MRNHKHLKALPLAVAAMMLMGSGVEAASTSAPSPTDKPSTELAGSAAQSAGRAGQTSVSLDSHHPSAAIADVSVSGTSRLDKEHLLDLLPELKKDHADIKKLSRQIQLINDTGSIKLHTRFRPAADGRYNVIIDAEDVQRSFFGLGIANSGNVYTGNWRTTASWIKTGAGRGADTFGAAYVTSPSGGHLSDVKQAAISYRAVLPKSADTLTFTASWSDVTLDMDQASLAGLDINAGGRGTAAGLHYRHNFSYTSRNKDFLDIGYDHKHTSDDQSINFAGVMLPVNNTTYDVDLLSIGYTHMERTPEFALTYGLGYTQNMDAKGTGYKDVGSYDSSFKYWSFHAACQYRTAHDWVFGLRGNAQATEDSILPVEQFGAGGMYSVRGFDERIISGDGGASGSFEIYTPEIAKNQRLIFFADAGWIHNNSSSAYDKNVSLGSAGVGYRWIDREGGMALSVDYAVPTNDLPHEYTADRGHKRWNMSLNMSF